jgi:Holliday junction resolvase-like predicted endonuclease
MRSSVITSLKTYERARQGETEVAQWLTQHGFRLIARNFRRRSLELDLVACKDHDLLIIEVKTRSDPVDDWQQLIPPRKLQALWRGIERFLLEHPEYLDYTVHLGLALVAKGIQWMRLPAGPDLEPK